MRISKIENDSSHIVLDVTNIDELMRKRQQEQKILEERQVYARLHALAGSFMVVYVVDPETDEYREFSSSDDYEKFMSQAKTGVKFFDIVREVSKEAFKRAVTVGEGSVLADVRDLLSEQESIRENMSVLHLRQMTFDIQYFILKICL